MLLSIQAFVTLIFAPMAMFWLFGVISDILITTKHPLFGIEVSIPTVQFVPNTLAPQAYVHCASLCSSM